MADAAVGSFCGDVWFAHTRAAAEEANCQPDRQTGAATAATRPTPPKAITKILGRSWRREKEGSDLGGREGGTHCHWARVADIVPLRQREGRKGKGRDGGGKDRGRTDEATSAAW